MVSHTSSCMQMNVWTLLHNIEHVSSSIVQLLNMNSVQGFVYELSNYINEYYIIIYKIK